MLLKFNAGLFMILRELASNKRNGDDRQNGEMIIEEAPLAKLKCGISWHEALIIQFTVQ